MKHIRHSSQKKDVNLDKVHFRLVGIIISIIGFGVLVQAFRWQIVQGEKFATLAKAQYSNDEQYSSTRGTISASDGTVLAVDEPAWDVYASLSSLPKERDVFFNHKSEYVSSLSAILAIPEKDIEKKLTDDFMYVKIKENVETDKKKALEAAEIFPRSEVFAGSKGFLKNFGLHYIKKEKRVYPNGKLASHILGFIGKDTQGKDVGQYGIEGFYFSDIVGKEGYTYEEKDSVGNVILTSEYDPVLPRQGKDFTLTINPATQLKVEKWLKDGVKRTQAKSGSAIVMDPNTGRIIAMANYPDYNPNEYWKTTDSWIFKNKAVADTYEYGSVQKPVTESIGLESGNVKENFICHDKTGYLQVYEEKLYTWNKQPNGNLTLGGILEKSNNPCAATVALQTGHKYYYPAMGEFGIGRFIGIGLQDEATGYLKPYEEWTKLDLAVTSFGQSISATALQVVSAISTIANEGNRMRPYIIEKVKEGDEEISIKPQVIASPISSKTASTVAGFMEGVVRKGEAKTMFNTLLPDYSIAGKTGTAQIPKKNTVGYYKDKTNTTFVGFAPVKEAKMIMIVRIEEPRTNTYAVNTAVPTWINIFKAIADDLEIPRGR